MREFSIVCGAGIMTLVLATSGLAQAGVPAANNSCSRPAQGSVITNPPDLYSENGVLNVTLDYFTNVDQWGRTLFCYNTPDGLEAPTLHLNPGDTLQLTLNNDEQGSPQPPDESAKGKTGVCGALDQTPQSVNLHFHGLNVSPRCHSDDVIHTFVNPGESFTYTVRIPKDEPPGMYWYHAHVHGIASAAVQGGASGAIEIEGIANFQQIVGGLPERFLIIRDQSLQNPPKHQHVGDTAPANDISLNFVPIPYPAYTPGVIKLRAGAQEFWRVVNGSADTVMDLQLLYDGQAQPLQIVALDGVPTGSHDGKRPGKVITQNDILIPPGGRAEFVITGPSASIKRAILMTRNVDTGPDGYVETARPLADIQLTDKFVRLPRSVAVSADYLAANRSSDPDDAVVTAHRRLFLEQKTGTDNRKPGGGTLDFICVAGQSCDAYKLENSPEIVTHKGAVEDWTIENQTKDVHAFHMHQIHFQVTAVDGLAIPPRKRQWYDSYQIGYWPGSGKYPKITVRMDFRGAVVGKSVIEDDILDNSDKGMIANIRVLPKADGS